MSEVVYLKLSQNTEVHEREVFLSQLGELWCRNKSIENRCLALKVLHVPSEKPERYVLSVMELIEKLEKISDQIEVNSIGETDCIIDYQPKPRAGQAWEWIKTAAVCLITFFGAAFAIMTFNNDGNVGELFAMIYEGVMGQKPQGATVLELTYSIGLPIGILVFFNHFSRAALSKDPTPIEVQMRTYETDVNQTLIKNAGREESGVDVT